MRQVSGARDLCHGWPYRRLLHSTEAGLPRIAVLKATLILIIRLTTIISHTWVVWSGVSTSFLTVYIRTTPQTQAPTLAIWGVNCSIDKQLKNIQQKAEANRSEHDKYVSTNRTSLLRCISPKECLGLRAKGCLQKAKHTGNISLFVFHRCT